MRNAASISHRSCSYKLAGFISWQDSANHGNPSALRCRALGARYEQTSVCECLGDAVAAAAAWGRSAVGATGPAADPEPLKRGGRPLSMDAGQEPTRNARDRRPSRHGRSCVLGNDPSVLADHDAIGVGMNVDRTADRWRSPSICCCRSGRVQPQRQSQPTRAKRPRTQQWQLLQLNTADRAVVGDPLATVVGKQRQWPRLCRPSSKASIDLRQASSWISLISPRYKTSH